MSSIPSISGKKAVKAFERLGFVQVRTNGSHVMMKKDGHEALLTVPVHANKDLKTGTLRGLIKDSGATHEEFLASLD
ncbi:MAG: addiction module toxin, HicA family [Planctomycetaceae bacterium]|nr:addiction module toxin, HicA family [Planctomycetaceae bacterium]